MKDRVSDATIERFRHLTGPQRNQAVAEVLLGDAPADVEREVLSYRAVLVTALREQGLWPNQRGRGVP